MVKPKCHNPSQELWGKLDSLVTVRALRWFFFFATGVSFFVAASLYGISNGQRYALDFVDIDGNKLSTSDGHVTVLVLATNADSEKVRAVGDRAPDFCLGNSRYRMISIIHFVKKHTSIGRKIATMLVRHRVNEEAKRLQARYNAKKIARHARNDIFTVMDFDGTAASQLGEQADAASFHIFVFGGNGELLQQWNDVPSAADLAAALK
jgi:hypothetical protein